LELPGPELMALCWRTPAYSGAMAARLASEDDGAGSGRDIPLGKAGTVTSDADGLPLGDLFDIG
jgi:hypothetical protein